MSLKPRGGVEVQLYSFFNLSVGWRWVVNATPRPFYPPRKRFGVHYTKIIATVRICFLNAPKYQRTRVEIVFGVAYKFLLPF